MTDRANEGLKALLDGYEERRRSVFQRALALDAKALAELLPAQRDELDAAEARVRRLPSTREELEAAEGSLDAYEKELDFALSVLADLGEQRAGRLRRRRHIAVAAACLGLAVTGLVAVDLYIEWARVPALNPDPPTTLPPPPLYQPAPVYPFPVYQPAPAYQLAPANEAVQRAPSSPSTAASPADEGAPQPSTRTLHAFQGKLGGRGDVRLAFEQADTQLEGVYTAGLGAVGLRGEMKDDTHLVLSDVPRAGAPGQGVTIEATMHGGTLEGTWRENGKPEPFSATPLVLGAKDASFGGAYAGTLGPDLHIRAEIERSGTSLEGRYQYVGQSEDLRLDGTIQDDGGVFVLHESTPNGTPTGTFRGVLLDATSAFGRWTSPRGSRSFLFTLSRSKEPLPDASAPEAPLPDASAPRGEPKGVVALCARLLTEVSNPAFCRTEPVSTKLGTPQLSVVGYAGDCRDGEECCDVYKLVLVAHDGGAFRRVADLGLNHDVCVGCCRNEATVLGGETTTIGDRSVVVVKSSRGDHRRATPYGPFCDAEVKLETVCALGDGARPTRCVSVPVSADMGCTCSDSKPDGVEASEWAACRKSAYHTEARLTWSLSADGKVVVKQEKASGDMSKALGDFTDMPDVRAGVIGSHPLF